MCKVHAVLIISCLLQTFVKTLIQRALKCFNFMYLIIVLFTAHRVWNKFFQKKTQYPIPRMRTLLVYSRYKILQLSSGIGDLTPLIWRYVLYTFIFRLVILLGSIKSIKSIEKVSFLYTFQFSFNFLSVKYTVKMCSS